MKTKEKILKNKIIAIETALKINDWQFIKKWHSSREWAEKDLADLKERLNCFQNGNSSNEKRGIL
ncbi:hypothetical protein [Enterococcus mundtii]|uniref:Uncharacterized protein n=1 Tax=Enterococcus mundtii TaxID=53346 RepID=A0A2S7RUB2_ENTMU|nr:hypothetical protein [Enterococcus mundtii]MBO1087042.1 hypothetical protein [Enterococcus mundtii]PQF23383.1 hypothetical protein CUS89_07385 [Enterococcus mundtii]